MGNTTLKELLKDKDRNKLFQIAFEDIVFDYSHEKMDVDDRDKLVELYEEKKVKEQFLKMFKGDKINFTEDRAVLHTALRKGDLTDHPEIYEVQMKMKDFTNGVRNAEIKGHSGKKLTNFVSIGIGGSYLAGEFVYQALKDNPDYSDRTKGYNLRFLANICPIDFKRAFEGLDPETTLVIIISKTFTTKETMMNAESAKHWLLSKYPNTSKSDEASILSKHCIAVSTNKEATARFGIDNKNVFGFWDWVGGRYSVWSAVGGIPLSLMFGYDIFDSFLKGGESIDKHLFKNLDNPKNSIPVMLGLIGYYNVRKLEISSRAILPYFQALNKFAAHIQQLDMESNGKQVNKNNEFISEKDFTGPIVFGEPGTNGQHSFYQLIHQGRNVACEFIGFANSQNELMLNGEKVSNHEELMSNFFAQPDALANGLSKEELKDVKEDLLNHKTFKGDKSSVSFLFKELNAYTCGQLLSIYEHRVATEGFLYEINSFDQYGVELGKVTAGEVRKVFAEKREKKDVDIKELTKSFNSATSSLIESFYAMRK